MAIILVLHGPNLNLLGRREPTVYGTTCLASIDSNLATLAKELGHSLFSFQSNQEGALIDRLQNCLHDGTDFIILNPAAYTHTSIALRDTLLAINKPFIEVHLSNIYRRETFRQHSYFSDIALGVISGLGSEGYRLALQYSHYYLTHKINLGATNHHGLTQN